jgi:adenine-specific DNA-methyltransferase
MELDDLSKSELVDLIKKLRLKKKYGIVWEDEKIREHFKNLEHNQIPIFVENDKNALKNSNKTGTHLLVEGENYLALTLLKYTHNEKIDCIYIDPPYNKGRDFIYNDDYVDREDSYRHSKWLSFMNKRLRLAKELLKEEGVIFISIDDTEHSKLRLLCEEIFGEKNIIGDLSVVNNLKGRSDEGFFATAHEYLIVCAKNKDKADLGGFPLDEDQIAEYDLEDELGAYKLVGLQKTGKQSLRADRPNMFYPIYWDESTGAVSLERSKKSDIEILPLFTSGAEGRWRWGKDTFNEKNKTELVVKKQKRGGVVYVKMRLNSEENEERTRKPKSFWLNSKYDSGSATTGLAKMFGEKVFDNPKPIAFLQDIFTISTTKDSTILDFFAGSGSTGEAVLRLNEQDGGNRRFILVTNNEEKICENVTYPRLKKVIKGYEDAQNIKVEGVEANLRHLKTEFIDKSQNSDEMKIRLTENIVDILKVKENLFDPISVKSNEYKIFGSKERLLAIYHSFDPSSLNNLKEEVEKLKAPKTHLYVFTFDKEGINQEDFAGWLNTDVLPIPQGLLENLENFNVG